MNLLSAAAKVSSLTMLSRITGLLRETLIARSFGASEWTDAFNVAFRLPNLLRRLFAEGAFSQAFVPILGEVSSQGDIKQSQILVNAVATLLFWALLLTVLLGVVGAPLLILAIATGFQGGPAYEASVVMTRIMFPYIGLISMVSLSAGILNTFGRFAIPAFTPVLLNLALIGSAIFLAPHLEQPIYALSIGVLLGGFLQLAIQVPALSRLGLLPRVGLLPGAIKTAIQNPDARRVMKLMGPAVFAVSVAQISLIINTNIASHLQTGSVSWLSYADRLMEFPTALLGVALGTVLLPSLSKANAKNDLVQAGELLIWGLRLTFFICSTLRDYSIYFWRASCSSLVSLRKIYSSRRFDDTTRIGRLWCWTHWSHLDQDPSPRVLLAPRYPYASQNWFAGFSSYTISQSSFCALARTCWISTLNWRWRLSQRNTTLGGPPSTRRPP